MYAPILLALLPTILAFTTSPNADPSTCQIPFLIPPAFQRSCAPFLSPTVDLESTPQDASNISSALIRSLPTLWSHEPYCVHSPSARTTFCVYTRTPFASGRGLSIICSREALSQVTSASAFRNPEPWTVARPAAAGKYTATPIPNKGLGNVATAAISQYEELHAETPLLLVQDTAMQHVEWDVLFGMLRVAVERLPDKSRRRFMELHGQFGGDPLYDRINTNAFNGKVGSGSESWWTVMPESSRFNHDCRPNAVYHFDPQGLTQHIHTVRPIAPGEEITVSYLIPTLTHAERHQKLKAEWGFQCDCAACNAAPWAVELSDARLSLISKLEGHLDDILSRNDASTASAELLVSLYESERLDGAMADAYVFVALEWAYVANAEKARQWADKAMAAIGALRGPWNEWYQSMAKLLVEPEGSPAWDYFARKKA
ncbi:SET domain-containing protein [Trichodelitschia bisporula]|uniref:SET domain-containing protein n=1 Tax=Trichodelitschia bisporula TaxID=703511 RepID=A0A6G1I9K9_9PEZI|nr:SET domain-containing protein [Trichodelitschia bisporula]